VPIDEQKIKHLKKYGRFTRPKGANELSRELNGDYPITMLVTLEPSPRSMTAMPLPWLGTLELNGGDDD